MVDSNEAVAERQPGEEIEQKYVPAPNPHGFKTDTLAGTRYLEHRDPYQSVIIFDEKPSQPIRDRMKTDGFTFDSDHGVWWKPVKFNSRIQDRVAAERTFAAVSEMIRDERGIEHEVGSPSF